MCHSKWQFANGYWLSTRVNHLLWERNNIKLLKGIICTAKTINWPMISAHIPNLNLHPWLLTLTLALTLAPVLTLTLAQILTLNPSLNPNPNTSPNPRPSPSPTRTQALTLALVLTLTLVLILTLTLSVHSNCMYCTWKNVTKLWQDLHYTYNLAWTTEQYKCLLWYFFWIKSQILFVINHITQTMQSFDGRSRDKSTTAELNQYTGVNYQLKYYLL